MLSLHEVETFLQPTKPQLRDIVFELRNLITEVAHEATEIILWKGLTYYLAARGGPVSAGICQIGLHPDHIRLAFIHGSFLPDPNHLLQGDLIAKRFVRIYSYEEAPWDDLKALIAASARFDPYTQTFRAQKG